MIELRRFVGNVDDGRGDDFDYFTFHLHISDRAEEVLMQARSVRCSRVTNVRLQGKMSSGTLLINISLTRYLFDTYAFAGQAYFRICKCRDWTFLQAACFFFFCLAVCKNTTAHSINYHG